ncbi:MAG: VWA domain-containing protein [Anaerolineae bacterium]|nr:VWA domain-containing protein [Anaerolineae bacterium]
MSFTNPNALFLLLLLPVVVAIGWPRLPYRRRDAASLVIRLILVTLIVLGLAGIQVHQIADKLAVVFLIDASDSIPSETQSAAVEYVRNAAQAMEEQDQAAVIVFGADALVEIPITERLELVQIGSDPIRLNTDMAEAMRLALALFPADTAKRMVVLSDGRQTVGDAEEVARLAAATDVQIDYVELVGAGMDAQTTGPEVLVSNVDVPSSVNEGERFNLNVTLSSTRAESQVEIRILSAGRVIHRREVTLPPGTTNEIFEIVAPNTGFADFQVVIEPRSADNFYQNNQLSAFTEVTGPPRVLLLTTESQEIEALRDVLTESGLQVDVMGPRDLPIGLTPLSSYDSIILANVSAIELGQERMDYMQAYVRDLGGGLIVIGGPDAYGVGGYYDTPLEETLPVDMQIRDEERIPTLTMFFVIDRSGSMEISSTGSVSNLELAKEAIVRSFDLLNDNDRTGVLSFDIAGYVVVDLQEIGDADNRDNLRTLVGALRPGGGTNILRGVQAAELMLQGDPSQLKHVILLTDGGADPSDIAETVDRMYRDYGITTSVVAVGQDYAPWLTQVAVAGRGQFHLAYDVSSIPAIFTAETLLATRSYIFEDDFFPTLNVRHPIISGVENMPVLKGYVATTDKETATVVLRGPEDDPILTTWQYGLGRAVAFMSDASSRWAQNWLTWDGFSDFWNQAVRWSIVEGNTSNIEARVVERGEQAVLTVDVRDTQGNFLNGLQLSAAVTDAQLGTETLALQQTAPGRYETIFTPEDEGAYFVTVAGSTPDDTGTSPVQSVIQTTGWVLSYSAEYRVDGAGADRDDPFVLLRNLATITGGDSLRDNPDSVFTHNLNQERAAQPIWQYFILAALLLLPFDVALRRLVITQRDLEIVREKFAAWFNRNEPVLVGDGPSSERLGRLRSAKDRVHTARQLEEPDERDKTAGQPDSIPSSPRRARSTRTASKPSAPRRSRSTTRPSPAPPSEGTLASRLLERRKSTQQDEDES